MQFNLRPISTVEQELDQNIWRCSSIRPPCFVKPRDPRSQSARGAGGGEGPMWAARGGLSGPRSRVKQFFLKAVACKACSARGFQAAVRARSFQGVRFSSLPASVEKKGSSLGASGVRKHLSGLYVHLCLSLRALFPHKMQPKPFSLPSSVPAPLCGWQALTPSSIAPSCRGQRCPRAGTGTLPRWPWHRPAGGPGAGGSAEGDTGLCPGALGSLGASPSAAQAHVPEPIVPEREPRWRAAGCGEGRCYRAKT